MTIPDLKIQLDAYLALREALGIRTKPIKLQLHSFVKYLELHASGEAIRAYLAVDWACTGPTISGKSTRLSMARGFLRYLKASCPETEIPDSNLIAVPRRTAPYLFSVSEIGKLLEAADNLRPSGSLRPHTHKTLFGLLACTGLRTSEATKLLVSDVQLNETPPRLLVTDTKFKKSRWIPLHHTAAKQLHRYAELRRTKKYDGLSDFFFVSEQGGKLHYDILERTFQRLLRRLEISPAPGQRRPTLHSFRHTFAVQRLRQWYEQGVDVRALAPNLSIYLGHVDPSTSYWYLTATPELLGAAAQLFQDYASQGGGR